MVRSMGSGSRTALLPWVGGSARLPVGPWEKIVGSGSSRGSGAGPSAADDVGTYGKKARGGFEGSRMRLSFWTGFTQSDLTVKHLLGAVSPKPLPT